MSDSEDRPTNSRDRRPRGDEARPFRPPLLPLPRGVDLTRGVHAPPETIASPLGSSFYLSSFRFRAQMREAPQHLLAQAKRAAADPSSVPGAPSPLGELRPSLRTLTPRGELAHAPGGPSGALAGPVPSLRPEARLRDLRAALQDPETERSTRTSP